MTACGVSLRLECRGVLSRASYSFIAHYNGDLNYTATDSPCEPLTVTALTPTVATEIRSEEHTSELQSQSNLVCRLLLEKKKDLRTPTGAGRVTIFHSSSPRTRA